MATDERVLLAAFCPHKTRQTIQRPLARPVLILAAAYVRMFTEHQQHSTTNQMDVIRECAKRRGMQPSRSTRTGKSNLNIQGRDSLAQMIKDVPSDTVKFTSILVYDVSRWGRFQDTDESA